MASVTEKVLNTVGLGSSVPPSKQTILITGASGFVAAHVLNSFLEAGYNVRGTVRSEATAEKVKKSHAKYIKQLSFSIVPDIVADGAFDEAVKGVDGVIHTASPFQMAGISDNEKELLQPAMKGTENILVAVKKYAPQVKRVVITSSFASIVNINKGTWPEKTYSEADWNPVTYDEAAAKDAPAAIAYCASKTFAEKAAWSFVEHEKPNFSVATICPPMVYGPLDHGVSSVSNLNTSSADIYRLMNGSTKEVPNTDFAAFVDVRDVGLAHVRAYEKPEAAGQRFFITAGNFSYQEVCDIIRKDFPELREKTPEGKPGSGLGGEVYKLDNSKAQKVLGIKFRNLEETIKDTVTSLLKVEKGETS